MMIVPGDRFGDYTVVRLLGKGGMGAVFLLETADGGQIAAKILDPEASGDEESRKRFLREAQLALGVKHPNLVEVYDVGEDPDTGLCYILMEYVPGGSLSDRIKLGPLPVSEAISIVYQIASVLELARQKGIVHRDIKPDNIMFGADGKAKLADLGIARQGGAAVTTVTQTGMMIGTPAYMAPEQMLDSHNVDTRADIYSLGIVFYEMLVGKRPNADDTVVQLMAKAVAGEPIPDVRQLRPEVSASLAELINLMCAMRADERVQTPYDVTLALSQIVHGKEVTIRRKRPSSSDVPNSKKQVSGDTSRRLLAAAFGLLVVAGLGVFGYQAMQRQRAKRATDVPAVAVRPESRVPDAPSPETVVREVTNVVERTVVATNVVERTVTREQAGAKPVAEKPRRPFWDGQNIDWRRFGPLQRVEADGRTWWYRLTDGGEVVLSRCVEISGVPMNAGETSCVSPVPSGALDVPKSLDGHPVVGIGFAAFAHCRMLTSVNIPEGVVAVGPYAFYCCHGLTDVRLPDSLRVIDEVAFVWCNRMASIDLNLVESMRSRTFPDSCREFRVAPGNPVYSVEDGVLYADQMRTLVRYPFERLSRPLNPAVTRIFSGAFAGLKDRELVLPEQVQEIGAPLAFLSSVEKIRIGPNVRRLEMYAFARCENLRYVVFEGDAPELFGIPRPLGEGVFVPDDQKIADWNRGDLTVFVHKSSRGWNRPGETGLPKRWPTVGNPACARPIRYIEDGVPEVGNGLLSADRVPPLPSKTFNLPRRQVLELVGCPAGKFTMGYPGAVEHGHAIAKEHEVSITRPFWIGKHPVTRNQWAAMAGNSELELTPVDKALGGMKAPVSNVNLPEIAEFCKSLTRRLRSGIPKGYVFRLPTDAEWEYAARAGSSAQDDPHVRGGVSDRIRSQFAVTLEDRLVRMKRAGLTKWREGQVAMAPFEVCTKKPNGWGIYDLLENVEEWLLDSFSLTASDGSVRKPVSIVTDIGPYQDLETDPFRTYDDTDKIGMCRANGGFVGMRRFVLPSVRAYPLGFRVVLGPDLERERKTQKPAKRRK